MNVFFLFTALLFKFELCAPTCDESIVLLDCKGGLLDDDDTPVLVVVDKLAVDVVFDWPGLVRNDVSGVLSDGKTSSRASFSMSTSNPFILPLYSLFKLLLVILSFRLAIDDVFDDELFDSTLDFLTALDARAAKANKLLPRLRLGAVVVLLDSLVFVFGDVFPTFVLLAILLLGGFCSSELLFCSLVDSSPSSPGHEREKNDVLLPPFDESLMSEASRFGLGCTSGTELVATSCLPPAFLFGLLLKRRGVVDGLMGAVVAAATEPFMMLICS